MDLSEPEQILGWGVGGGDFRQADIVMLREGLHKTILLSLIPPPPPLFSLLCNFTLQV